MVSSTNYSMAFFLSIGIQLLLLFTLIKSGCSALDQIIINCPSCLLKLVVAWYVCVALWSTGVNGVFHHNEAQEHVEISRPAGQAAQSQGKQATNNDWNPNVRHTMNLVSSTDQCSMFNFLLRTKTANHQLYLLSQGPVVLRYPFGYLLTSIG